MIIIDSKNVEYVSYGGFYTVILRGKFSEITQQEYRFISCHPANILITENFQYDSFSFKLSLKEKKKIKKWFWQKEVITEYALVIYSTNSLTQHMYSFPTYDYNLYGEFVFEMVISRENYKKYVFQKELRELLGES